MKFSEYVDLAEQERHAVIDALLNEIYDLKRQLAEYKRAEKKELVPLKRKPVGFKQGGKKWKVKKVE